jgi:hypothetical protein
MVYIHNLNIVCPYGWEYVHDLGFFWTAEDWEFLKDDEPWYCWACSKRKRKPFTRDDRAIQMPMPGDAVYVASDGSLREYALFLFDEGVSENMMRITNVSTVRWFCIVVSRLI